MRSRLVGIQKRLEAGKLSQTLMGREVDRLEKQGIKSLSELLLYFSSFDPHPKKQHVQWMTECYARNGFLLEDLVKVHDALDEFTRIPKHLLPLEKRDIQKYQTLNELYDVLDGLNDRNLVSERMKDRADKQRAWEESEFLVRDDEKWIVVPNTPFAAKWWGLGTRWCTSSRGETGDYTFNDYNSRGPLVVLVRRGDGRKAQFYVRCDKSNDNSDFQAMDEKDRYLMSEDEFGTWCFKTMEPLLHQLHADGLLDIEGIQRTMDVIEWSREERLAYVIAHPNPWIYDILDPLDLENDMETALRIIRETPGTSRKISVEQQILPLFGNRGLSDDELSTLYLESLNNPAFALVRPMVLKDRAKELKLWNAALEKNGNLLVHFPKRWMEDEIPGLFDIYRTALTSRPASLRFLPKHHRTHELLEICNQNLKSREDLKYFPRKDEAFRTPERLMEWVRRFGAYAFPYISAQERRDEMYEYLIQNADVAPVKGDAGFDVRAIWTCLPTYLKTRELAMSFLEKDPTFILVCPQKFVNSEVAMNVLERAPELYYALRFKTWSREVQNKMEEALRSVEMKREEESSQSYQNRMARSGEVRVEILDSWRRGAEIMKADFRTELPSP